MIQKIKKYVVSHKIISVIAVVVVAGAVYGATKVFATTSAQASYALATVEKGTLITSVSGTGQVSASNEVEVKSKVSGDVLSVGVVAGQEVKKGALIAQIDAGDAEKAVRDAQTSLETAQLSLDKIVNPDNTLTLLQAQNNVTEAKQSETDAETSQNETYEKSYNTLSSVYIDLPDIISELDDLLAKDYLSNNSLTSSYGDTAVGYRKDALTSYYQAKEAYNDTFADFKVLSSDSSDATIESNINHTLDTTKIVTAAVKNYSILLEYIDKQSGNGGTPVPQDLDADKATINADVTKLNGYVTDLAGAQTSMVSAKDAVSKAKRTIEENTLSLANVEKGADSLDIRTAQLSVQSKQDAVQDARETLADYSVRAPFDGIVASVDVNVADNLSSNTALATLITKQKVATISFNEVDAAKIALGQKATLTFDALPDLTISGEVIEVDQVGTVTQGVVTYSVKIGFDTQDDRVKSGMSVSAAIVTQSKTDALLIPSSALKSDANGSYVQVLGNGATSTSATGGVVSTTPPQSISVEVGISNDTQVEITSGLKEGDKVITKTTTASATTAAKATSATSLLGGSSGRTGGIPR